jgi:hypothetical protein
MDMMGIIIPVMRSQMKRNRAALARIDQHIRRRGTSVNPIHRADVFCNLPAHFTPQRLEKTKKRSKQAEFA